MIIDEGILVQIESDKLILEQDLLNLAKEAMEAAKLIKNCYKFEEGIEKIKVYNDGYNEEYVTSDNFWHARYLEKEYIQDCSAEKIYELYRNQYLFEHKYFDEDYYIKQNRIASNFREFVKHTRLKK